MHGCDKIKNIFQKIILQLIILILLFSFFILTPRASAFEAEVIVTLDKHDIEYILGPNASANIYISGNVTCNMEGLGENVQRVELELWASTYEDWYAGVGPSHMTFHSNGRKSLNLTISIPINTYNNTKNIIIVDGHWRTEPYHSIIDSSGYPKTDQVNVTVIRTMFIGAPTTTTPEYEEYEDFWEGLELYQRIILGLIPFILIIILIIILLYRRKKLNALLSEK